MADKGLASEAWGKGYDPNPVPRGWRPKVNIRLVPSQGKSEKDPMCDYIPEGAVWWVARSDRSVGQLQKAFDQQEVACLLYEKTGAIVKLGRAGAQYLIAIQLVRNDDEWRNWDLDVSLSDAGIYLEEVYVFPEEE